MTRQKSNNLSNDSGVQVQQDDCVKVVLKYLEGKFLETLQFMLCCVIAWRGWNINTIKTIATNPIHW